MKLKYLLPITTVASVATVITPLTTSCGNSNTASWTKGDVYKPLTPKKKEAFKDDVALLKSYRDDVDKNKFIYSDDQVNWCYQLTIGQLKEDFNIRAVKVTTTAISDLIDCPPVNDFVPNDWTKYVNVSFDFSLDATIIISSLNKSILEFNKRSGKITNLPIIVSIDPQGAIFTMIIPTLFLSLSTWNLNIPEIKYEGDDPSNLKLSIADNNKTYSIDDIEGDYVMESAIIWILQNIFTFESNYYQNMTLDAN